VSSVRRLVGVATVATLCTVTAGCTSGGGPDPASSPSPSVSLSTAAGTKPVSLDFGVYGTEQQLEAYADMAAAFTKNNPNVTITLERAPDAAAAMANLERRSERGDPPDVFLMEHDALPALMQEQRIQPVDALLEERRIDFGDGYQRDALEAFSADSSLQCMPHDVSPLVVYYNQDLLNLRTLAEDPDDAPTAEDGWTWEEFAQAARQMSRGRTKGVYIAPKLEELAPFIWSGGGDLVDDLTAPTTLTLSEEASREALEEVLTLIRDPLVTPTRAELNRQDAVDLFKRGRIGMLLGTRALVPQLRDADGLDFEVMPLPSLGPYRTITQMSGYCISADTKQLQAAADFLAFAVGREGATLTTIAGYTVPANLQVAHSPAFTQPGQQPENSFVYNEGVRRAEPTPFVREWPEVLVETRPFLERMFYAPLIGDLEVLLEEIDVASQSVLAPEVPPVEEE
jgi:multiple sugar transport system substrate-binding protein